MNRTKAGLLGRWTAWLVLSVGLTCVGSVWAETVTYFHNDIAGTPIAASDAAGNVIWKENYQPFGGRMNNLPASGSNDQWFAGKPVETATGLSYFGARYYDPALGRFMGIDPKEVDPNNLHSFNRYSYGNNNPYRFVDPDGRHPVLIVVVGVGLWVGTEVLFPQTPPAHAPDAIFPTTFPDVSAIGAKAILTLERAALRGAAETTAKDIAATGADKVVYRLGSSRESASRLARKSAEAEEAGLPHGVSVSTTRPPAGTPCSSARCSDLEASGLKVHSTPTRRDPNHHTVELPKPVTDAAAGDFNRAFGRD